jgi:DNA-binding NtrC family response regulator
MRIDVNELNRPGDLLNSNTPRENVAHGAPGSGNVMFGETRMEQKPNDEVRVMDAALRLLSGLQPDEQRRVLLWLSDKLNLAVKLSPRLQSFQSPAKTDALGEHLSLTTIRFPIGVTVAQVERELIFQTLSAANENKTRAADLLGISLKTLHNKLKEYKLAER